MANRDIVVIGASAGGMEALQKLVSRLPAGLPASLFVVWHLSPGVKSILPSILTKAGALPAVHPQDGDRIEPGRIYVAPNDHHMLLENGYIRVARGPKENRFRPAVDPLFRSAAYVYGPRVIGVVLTGALDDGTAGLWTIKLRGGTAIVQEPEEALIRGMPLNALDNVAVDYRLPVAEIGELLPSLVREPAGEPAALPQAEAEKTMHELRIAKEREALKENMSIEAGLWDAVRAADETVMLLNQLGEEFAKAGNTAAAEKCFDKAREAHERLAPIREAANDNDELGLEKLREKAV